MMNETDRLTLKHRRAIRMARERQERAARLIAARSNMAASAMTLIGAASAGILIAATVL